MDTVIQCMYNDVKPVRDAIPVRKTSNGYRAPFRRIAVKKTALALAGIAGLATGLALVVPRSPEAVAQDTPQPPPRQGGPEEGGMRRPFMGMMGQGQGSMVALDKHLYVLMGATVYKIDPEKMEVVKKLELVQPGEMRRPNAAQPGAGPDAGRQPRRDQ